jgi:hypothetical protein
MPWWFWCSPQTPIMVMAQSRSSTSLFATRHSLSCIKGWSIFLTKKRLKFNTTFCTYFCLPYHVHTLVYHIMWKPTSSAYLRTRWIWQRKVNMRCRSEKSGREKGEKNGCKVAHGTSQRGCCTPAPPYVGSPCWASSSIGTREDGNSFERDAELVWLACSSDCSAKRHAREQSEGRR